MLQLVQLGDSVEQSLYEKKASEISSQIELIQYKIDLSAGKGSAKRMIQLMSKMSVSLLLSIEVSENWRSGTGWGVRDKACVYSFRCPHVFSFAHMPTRAFVHI